MRRADIDQAAYWKQKSAQELEKEEIAAKERTKKLRMN